MVKNGGKVVPQVIVDTYELIREIGSGGGGIVYLANHLRLGKEVVVKVDKRRISAKPESLRREVDALKNLSHAYIPQVYDFIQNHETVYTVIDYIDGESLDKPLKRGETASQAQIIEWARQLLDALHYLHSKPPHGILHADIKPANIMLTPQGDIRLIDFNIALALGEGGAVSVGRSLGYASPEHLGLDFSPSGTVTGSVGSRTGARATTVLDLQETELISSSEQSGSKSSGK
ncbi:MAG: serine/threonine protein kinase, partial [Oscillospiraceae bacterium]|nr:serine/threonine protein kinase [Oscillospiraceae bacterium]